MKKTNCIITALKVLKYILLSVFLVFWTIGLFIGGLCGIASVICGIPFAVGFVVFE